MIVRAFLFLLFLLSSLEAHLVRNPPLKVPCYRLVDLGPTNLPRHLLNRHSWPLTYAPRLNNDGVVVGNRASEGFVWDSCRGFRRYRHKGAGTYFHDINNKGLILASAPFGCGCTEWLLWPQNPWMKRDGPLLVEPGCLQDAELYFRALNDKTQLIGARRREGEGCFTSVFWTPKMRAQILSYGVVTGINNENNMVGGGICEREHPPFLWNTTGGPLLFSDESCIKRPGKGALFKEAVVAPDNTVYGTYVGKKKERPYLYAYFWNPCERVFGSLDLNGMRISAVNNCHFLVGSCGREAVISANHWNPAPLIQLVKGYIWGWELIEATDINDLGQIVGYGSYFGKTHLFFLDPIRE